MRAVPTADDTAWVEKLELACATVGVKLVDLVVVGDDGFSSFLRVGLIGGGDARYR